MLRCDTTTILKSAPRRLCLGRFCDCPARMAMASAVALLIFCLNDIAKAVSGEIVRRSISSESGTLAFEPNQGQTHPQVKFLARAPGYTVFLTSREAVLALGSPEHKVAVLRMRLVGANLAAELEGDDALPGTVNHFKSGDPNKQVTKVPTYQRVRHRGVYPGVDLVYHANHRQLEYDFVIAPGADPQMIVLWFEGADRQEVGTHGELVLHTAAGVLRQLRPVIYQDIDDIRREITGSYIMKADGQVGISVQTYDSGYALVIDPILAYATYLGGNNADRDPLSDPLLSGASSIAVDGAGNAYVTGSTASPDFPITAGNGRTLGVSREAFVAKFSSNGTLVYSTYLGGQCEDLGRGIAIDATGNAYVTGRANEGCPQAGVLVTKLDPTGGLVYRFAFGGSLADTSSGQAIAVDDAGNAYVTGVAKSISRDFPTTAGAFRTVDCGTAPNSSGFDAFVAKINAAGNALVYSTYLCGTADDSPSAIAIDTAGNAYIAGGTTSQDFPTTNAFQATHHGGPDNFTGFVAKLDPTGSNLVYSTYLGGSFGDIIGGIAVDPQGNVYVTGQTGGGDFPTTAGVVQPTAPGPDCFLSRCTDAFVTKLNVTGSVVYSTLLGGERDDAGAGITIDAAGNIYVVGDTFSRYLPIRDAFKSTNTLGEQDAFVTKLNSDATRIVYSSYLGGTKLPNSTSSLEGTDSGVAIGLDAAGNAYVTGYTWSLNFPTTAAALQSNPGGGTCGFGEPCGDLFVAKINAGGPGVVPAIHLEVTPTEVQPGGTITAMWGGIPEPTAKDQLMLFPLGALADRTSAVASVSTTGAENGTRVLALPGGLASGTYELRLMSPDPNLTAELTVIARSEPLSILTPITLIPLIEAGDTFRLRFNGAATETYNVEATDTLAPPDWKIVSVLKADEKGIAEFSEKLSPARRTRFYRVSRL